MSTATASAYEGAIVVQSDRWSYRYAQSGPPAETYSIPSVPSFALRGEYTGSTWTVRDVETGVFGAGASPSDALQDFWRAVREHVDVLERQDALTDDLRDQLEYLRTRLGD